MQVCKACGSEAAGLVSRQTQRLAGGSDLFAWTLGATLMDGEGRPRSWFAVRGWTLFRTAARSAALEDDDDERRGRTAFARIKSLEMRLESCLSNRQGWNAFDYIRDSIEF